jgi:hypothetical protein
LIREDPHHRDRLHYLHWVNGVPINASHNDIRITAGEK